MKHITRWFKRLMIEYLRVIESVSAEGQSIVNLKRDRKRGRLSYANQKILEFSDLFSVVEEAQVKLIDLWYVEKKSSALVAKALGVSRATLYRKRLSVAGLLYQYRHLLYR